MKTNTVNTVLHKKTLQTAVDKPLSKSLMKIKFPRFPDRFQNESDLKFVLDNLAAIKELNVQLDEEYKSPTKIFIVTQVEHLQSYYFAKEQSNEIFKLHVQTWIDDLIIYPEIMVELACARWRNSPNKYSPATAGELMHIIQDDFTKMKALMCKIDTMLGIVKMLDCP